MNIALDTMSTSASRAWCRISRAHSLEKPRHGRRLGTWIARAHGGGGVSGRLSRVLRIVGGVPRLARLSARMRDRTWRPPSGSITEPKVTSSGRTGALWSLTTPRVGCCCVMCYRIDLAAAIADAAAKFGVDCDVENGGELDCLEGEHARGEQRMATQRAPVPNVRRAKDRIALRHRATPVLANEREVAGGVVAPLRVDGAEPGAAFIVVNHRAGPGKPAPARDSS